MKRMDREDIRKLLKVYFIMGSVNCRISPAETLSAAADGESPYSSSVKRVPVL